MRIQVYSVLLLVAGLLIPQKIRAAEDVDGAVQYGMGISLGAPTGLGGQLILSPESWVGAELGMVPVISEGFHGSLVLAGSYQRELLEIIDARDYDLHFYGGAGLMLYYNLAGVEHQNEATETMVPFYSVGLGAIVPLGLKVDTRRWPLGFSLELRPALGMTVPARDAEGEGLRLSGYLWNLSFSGRYYF